ncbi:MAG: hypothetical protein N3E51_05320 [Candidatus Micrarchaeota archaeon]|nr:hypothetical protein [Candidatus Micrarchaeota archaeon]
MYFDMLVDPLNTDMKLRDSATKLGVTQNEMDNYLSNAKLFAAAIFVVVAKKISAETFWIEYQKTPESDAPYKRIENTLRNIGGEELVSQWKEAIEAIINAMYNCMGVEQAKLPTPLSMMTAFDMMTRLLQKQQMFSKYAREQALEIGKRQNEFYT